MADDTVDVIVIGGGIVGCSAAHFLSRRGVKVLLVEKDAIAAHASGFAFGVLLPRIFDDPSDPLDSLTRLSLELHQQISDELSRDSEKLRRKKASVLLARDKSTASQYRGLYRSDSLLGDTRWLEYGELSHIEARISPEVHGGLYLGDNAEVSPSELSEALWRSAEANGARMITASVGSVVSNRTGGVEVVAGDESYSAGHAIVAAGPWSSKVLEAVGTKVPVEPLKGQIVRLNAPGPEMKVSLWWDSDYAGSKPDGLLWCGTTEERVGFNEETTDAARDGILSSAIQVLPFLADAEVAIQTACLRPVSADGLPVVGESEPGSNIIVATGGGRNGIVLGPVLGKMAAEIITGSGPGLSVDFLSPTRFLAR